MTSGASRDIAERTPRSSRDEQETAAVGAPTAIDPVPEADADRISRYVVLEEVGRGGMGRVLRAYDPKLQREVALKVVRSQWLGKEGARRLVAEARAMAKLSHRNVVSVYDVEELSGRRLVLVMEFVAGSTLSSWLTAERSWSEVVEAFVAAGRGLAAAHAAGLLHRDFKPANVLVSATADEGGAADHVKVTDFGLAKHAGAPTSDAGVSSPGSDADTLTQEGDVIGTPRYMAPEQHRGVPLTSAADQYAFCVALWEALTGTPPFSGDRMMVAKFEGPPAWPRGDVPRAVVRAVTRGLSVKPEARWPNMDALLQALSAHRTRRRSRAVVVGAVAAASVVIVGWQAWASARAERCSGAAGQLAGAWDDARRDAVQTSLGAIGAGYAQAVAARTTASLDDYATQWSAMHADACEASTIRGEQSAAVMDLRMACLQRARVRLQSATDVLVDADADVVAHAHQVVDGLPPLSRCADVDALTSDVEPPLAGEAEAVALARAHLADAESARHAVRHDDATRAITDAKAALDGTTYGPIRAEVAVEEASLLAARGEYDQAESVWRDALREASMSRQWDRVRDAAIGLLGITVSMSARPEDATQLLQLAQGLAEGDPRSEAAVIRLLGTIRGTEGKTKEAEALHREAIAILEELGGAHHRELVDAYSSLGIDLIAQGRHDEAEVVYRHVYASLETALGPDHPEVSGARNDIAIALVGQRRSDEAIRELREIVTLQAEAYGRDHPHVATAEHNLAAVLIQLGAYDEAIELFGHVARVRLDVLGPDHANIASTHATLAVAYQRSGRFDDAAAQYRKALGVRQRSEHPDHPRIAVLHTDLGAVIANQGDLAGAAAEFRQALEIWGRTDAPDERQIARTRFNLASMLEEMGDIEGALAEHRRALAMQERIRGDEAPEVALSRVVIANLLREQGDVAQALALAEQAWASPHWDRMEPDHRATAAFVLARVLWTERPRERERARELAATALEEFLANDPPIEEEAARVRRWLDQHERR